VARDREEPGAEARVGAEAVEPLETREERLLDEIVDVVVDLVAEEAVELLEVALEQRATRLLIAAAPRDEQLPVGPHRDQPIIAVIDPAPRPSTMVEQCARCSQVPATRSTSRWSAR